MDGKYTFERFEPKNPQPRQTVITHKRVAEMFPFMEEIEYKIT